jgi:hypothetical protein
MLAATKHEKTNAPVMPYGTTSRISVGVLGPALDRYLGTVQEKRDLFAQDFAAMARNEDGVYPG